MSPNSAKALANDLLGLNKAQLTDSSPAYLCAQVILSTADDSIGSQIWSFAKHVVGETGLAVRSDIASAAMRLTEIVNKLP